MSVVAIHPRTHSPAAAPRQGPSRRRPSSTADAPVLRVTVDVPLLGERLVPELTLLLELVRDLADRGEAVVAVTGPAGSGRADPAEVPPVGRPAGHQGRTGHQSRPKYQDRAGYLGRGIVDVLADDTAEGGSFGVHPGRPRSTGPGGEEPGALRVLTGPRVVLRDGLPVPFTRLEFDLLVFLARHPRRVFTRLQLLSSVWGYEHAVARTVDVHVRRLRAKAGTGIAVVTTVHGVGYRLADDAPVRLDDSDDGPVVGDEVWGPGVSLL